MTSLTRIGGKASVSAGPWASGMFTHETRERWHMLLLRLINHRRSDVHRRQCGVSFDTWLAFLSLCFTLNITPAARLNWGRSAAWQWRAIAQADRLSWQHVQRERKASESSVYSPKGPLRSRNSRRVSNIRVIDSKNSRLTHRFWPFWKALLSDCVWH